MSPRRRPLIVLGCTSGAGKSLIATALVRWFARQGVDVVPFKAQNMSNNARVVEGGEIGVAQWLQAVAAGVEPDVRMNPVLLKPEADERSQVIVDGVQRRDLSALPWRQRSESLWPAMQRAYDSLQAEHELVVIEGAGSPAEINLTDLANNRILEHADAAALLVADIDRGGAFAHLYGTWSLAPVATRRRLAAFVLNKFRGDASLLAPAPAVIEERTTMRDAGVLPMLRHELPDEEGATVRAAPPPDVIGAADVAVVAYPYASNLDELHLVGHVAHVRLATRPANVTGADLIVLPGSKHVAADAAWLRDQGLAQPIRDAAARGRRVLGICGGAMLLGGSVRDPDGVEGATDGLGLLDIDTVMQTEKVVRPVTMTFDGLPEAWAALNGATAAGYEIRNGVVGASRVGRPDPGARWWAGGSVLATTVHGMLEDPDLLARLFGRRPPPVLERTCELLADAVDRHLDTRLLSDLVRRR